MGRLPETWAAADYCRRSDFHCCENCANLAAIFQVRSLGWATTCPLGAADCSHLPAATGTMCALPVASESTSWREQPHGSQPLRTRRFHAHSFVVARLGSQLAGRGERPSLLRPSRACLRYRPLLPGSSNLGGGRGPRDSLLPGRTGGEVSRRIFGFDKAVVRFAIHSQPNLGRTQ